MRVELESQRSHYSAVRKRLYGRTTKPPKPKSLPLVSIIESISEPIPEPRPEPIPEPVLHSPIVTVAHIQRVVARLYNVPPIDMRSDRRPNKIARARQIAMYLARMMTLHSFPKIGTFFGGRHHTTVLHAVSIIEDLISADPTFAAEIEAVKAAIETP